MFREEFTKIVTNVSFYLAIMAVVILMMAETFYIKADTGKEYSFFDIVLNKENDKIIKESGMVSDEIIINGANNIYYEMFIPLVVVIPFITGMYTDKKNNITRFQIYRTGKLRYTLGKFMAVIISGGFITMLGHIIFSIMIYAFFPHGKSEIFELNKMLLSQDSDGYRLLLNHFGDTGLYVLKFMRVFLYGAFSTVIAFALSAIIKNRYIILTIPVVIEYMWGKFIGKSKSIKLSYLRPSAISNIFYYDLSRMLPFFAIITISSLIFYRICLERKCDCGEE